ncbi:protein-tyrosine phosphatase-like protein [Multifurca ochricompacta]|uniref:Protein-tyrosine phosphatase-like protein n=1 Tax=Multifurca ochricompacta TaxID=376703 RepID=A0AAD4QJJ2_9AGAM|nr:protein-tyrosine phosphatase-like protein [Multifurca ochricompacta]
MTYKSESISCSVESSNVLVQQRTRASSFTSIPMSISMGRHIHRPRPFPNSYWATPLLVACEYPWTPTRANRSQKIDLLLRAGVRTFIDLTESGELSPYAPHLAAHVARLGEEVQLGEIEYHSFPIPDRCLPRSVNYVRQILDVLMDNARRGRTTAVHCRGGIGRTGVVVGCWLIESGTVRDGTEALRYIAEEWKSVEKCRRFPQSPETGRQCDFVRNFERLGGFPGGTRLRSVSQRG